MKTKPAALLFLLAGMTLACAGHAQQAAKYPTRPVRILIPFVPGGSTDFIARVMQTRMTEELGQAMVIDNRPGASGNIAVEIAAGAPPDGHTILFGNIGTIAINPALFREFRVDTVRDLQCVSVVADVSALLVLNSNVPVASFEEFARYSKSRPGQINFASPSPGSNSRLAMEFIASKSGIELNHVAYKGASAMIASLLSNETQIGIAATPTTIPHLKSGRLKALGLMGPVRAPALPQVPTLAEIGFPELTISSWQGLYAPAKTPAPVIATLRSAIAKAMTDPKAIETLKTGGAGPMDPALLAECAAFTKQQVGFWAGIVNKIGLAGKQ
jgi:tripartite-type tricarboxylate transporter receptor subunit TctC